MGNAYGSLQMPVPVPESVGVNPAADPLLETLLSFFEAVILYECADAWNAISGNIGGQPMVKRTFAHNPGPQAFREATTPALYLWRERIGPAVWRAAEYRIRSSRLILRWVPFMPNSQDRQRVWEPFFNAVPSVLDNAVEHGRHISWKVTGDTDANIDRGSFIFKYAKVWQLKIASEEAQRITLQIPMEGGAAAREFSACDIPILLEERLTRDLADGSYKYDEIAYIDTTQQVPAEPPDLPDPLTTNVGRFNFDPD